MIIKLWTTFDTKDQKTYFEALTKARPYSDSNALWFRLPDALKSSLLGKKQELIQKISEALDDEVNRKKIIFDVFEELVRSLETGFTIKEIEEIVENLWKFNNDLIVPIKKLKKQDYLFEEFHWPTDAFKDIALQMVTSMVSIIVAKENKRAIDMAKKWKKGQKLKFIITQTSTSWDTWPAWGSGIEGKEFVMNVIWFPENEATYAQKWQMINLWKNVKSLSMNTSFSNIQEAMLKGNTSEFREELKNIIREELKQLIEKYGFEIEIDAGSFNSINPGRVDGQTIYHAYGILQAKAKKILKKKEEILEVIPSGNGGHMYSVLMARLMVGQKWKTIVTCNRNNMFYKIIEEGNFQKPSPNSAIDEPSVSMIIEYPNNMIRLFSFAFGEKRAKEITDLFFAWEKVKFSKDERKKLKKKLWLVWVEISWKKELKTIWKIFKKTGILVCPHTANAIAGLKKYRKESGDKKTKALISATASPWKFLAATATWLSYKDTDDLEWLYKKYKKLENSGDGAKKLLEIIEKKYSDFGKEFSLELIPENLRNIYKNWYKSEKSVSPEDFWKQTLEFLKKEVAPKFREQVEGLI